MEIQPTKMSQGENESDDDHDEVGQNESDYDHDSGDEDDDDHDDHGENESDNVHDPLQHQTSFMLARIFGGGKITQLLYSSAHICRVPEDLRKLKENAYTPRLIAIGPLHKNDKHLKTPLHAIKLSYTMFLLARLTTSEDNPELARQKVSKVLRHCLAEMNASTDDAQKHYVYAADQVPVDEEMMLIDGCFILEFLYRSRSRKLECRAENQGKKPIDGEEEHRLKLLARWFEETPMEVMGQIMSSEEHRSSKLRWMEPSIIQPKSLGEHSRLMHRRAGETSTEQPKSLSIPEGQEIADPIFGNKLTASTVEYDLLFLENQIPFFVLEKLFKLTVAMIPNRPDNWLLTDYVWDHYGNIMMGPAEGRSGSTMASNSAKTWCSPGDCVLRVFGNKLENSRTAAAAEVQSGNTSNDPAEYYHILHQIHDAYLPRDETESEKRSLSELEVLMPSASDLDYAGVKFVPSTANNLFKVQFTEPQGLFWWYKRACFEIPQLKIYDRTESLLSNLIAFEQCCPGIPQHFTSYAILMNMLVSSEKDVQVLEKARVVRNCLGATEDAANLFKKLGKEVEIGEFFFANTCTKATQYSNRFWPKNMAYLRRTYFDSPWTFVAFCVGFIAFGMSFVQFVRDLLKKGG